VDVIDERVLHAALTTDEEAVVVRIYTQFATTLQDTVNDVHAAVTQRDCVAMAALAHRLKSSARLVGAAALADSCVEIEAAAKRGDWAMVQAQCSRFFEHAGAASNWVRLRLRNSPAAGGVAETGSDH
jgi:HPt (histidine-containing phosphotransfer) domain-containing protein